MSPAQAITVKLDRELSLHQANTVCEQLRVAINENHAVVVDGTNVLKIDTSILQLLIAARKSAEVAGKELSVRFAAGGALERALVRAGFIIDNDQEPLPEGDLWERASA